MNIYRVYDKSNGSLICEGTMKECSAKIGYARNALYNIHEGRHSPKFRVFQDGVHPCKKCKKIKECEVEDKVCGVYLDWFQLDFIPRLDRRFEA